MKPAHFAIIMLRVIALTCFTGIAYDLTYLPHYMASVYFARTATAIAYYRTEANMLLAGLH